ncbi:MAG: TIGR00730 family Rossman fold protein [Oligoflexia bacterium]|nr:TIGR00730 family Rossman fold protein [Oligoflexia bacterium]
MKMKMKIDGNINNMNSPKSLCIFCGSKKGKNTQYTESAKQVADLLIQEKWNLVYGGGSIGIMTEVADRMLHQGGNVYGVIPQSIVDLEVAHKNITKLHIVKDMHERKSLMYNMSDAFLILPGGLGTLDELCETLTWYQLKYHQKPSFILNIAGFYDHFLKHLYFLEEEGFLYPSLKNSLCVGNTIDDVKKFLKAIK